MSTRFEINAWIQEKIGWVIGTAIFLAATTIASLYINMQTNTLEMQALKAEIKQLSQNNANLSAQFTQITNKHGEEITGLKYEMGLVKQSLRYLTNRDPTMKGMINHEKHDEIKPNSGEMRPPIMTDWIPKEIVKKVGSSCTGKECDLEPVEPPKPEPIKPKPTNQ